MSIFDNSTLIKQIHDSALQHLDDYRLRCQLGHLYYFYFEYVPRHQSGIPTILLRFCQPDSSFFYPERQPDAVFAKLSAEESPRRLIAIPPPLDHPTNEAPPVHQDQRQDE
jgi:hypothetical protein